MSIFNLRSVLIGIVATLSMDVLGTAALKLRLIAFLPPRLTGRWFASMARGKFLHTDIAQVPPISHEMAVAVPVHYAIGIMLALVYLLLSSAVGIGPRNLIPALGFAFGTSLLPWLFMFPAMGYGWFGAQGPPGTRLFPGSLVTHCFYGIGLWLGVSIVT